VRKDTSWFSENAHNLSPGLSENALTADWQQRQNFVGLDLDERTCRLRTPSQPAWA